jgi:hypothetical protein
VVLVRDAMAEHLRMLWASGARSTDAQMVVQLADKVAPNVEAVEEQRFFIRPASNPL